MKEIMQPMSFEDKKMVDLVKTISEKGSHAEVKKDKSGKWIVYEVNKKKSEY